MIINLVTTICILALVFAGNASILKVSGCFHETEGIFEHHDVDCDHDSYNCRECKKIVTGIIVPSISKRVLHFEKIIPRNCNILKFSLAFDRDSGYRLINTRLSEPPGKLLLHTLLASVIIQS